jgi:hypothetical protein
MLGPGRSVGIAIVALVVASCGREGTWVSVIATPSPEVEEVTPSPSPEPTATPEVEPETPEPTAYVAVVTSAPTPRPDVKDGGESALPGGPDGSDQTKRDSGVRGRVMAGDRPVADAVVSVKGEGFQANSLSGPGGRFHVHAPAGRYLVTAKANKGIVRCEDELVDVDRTSFTTITISCKKTADS